jgi:hypothetical protein
VGSGWCLVAPVVFKTTARRIASWVGSIPMHSRHRRGVLLTLVIAVVVPSVAQSQRADSARVAPKTVVDTSTHPVPKPPLSPRRAFLYSLAIPGYGQSMLGRPAAGALFVLTESIALAMLRESSADLHEARQLRRDSLVVIGYDPLSGTPITQRNSYDDDLIAVRRGHVEDWIAFLAANHLFAAADAYVAAHLWDLPSQISVRQGPSGRGTIVGARLRW